MTEFTPGSELSEAFYREIVRPALVGLPHSAALLGAGSDVLGYDTARSTDHGWGARVLLFVEEGRAGETDFALPGEYRGYPVLGVRTVTVRGFFEERLAVDPAGPVGAAEWVTFSDQALLEVTRGKVFHDGLGTVEPVRARFAYYPDEVWRYLLAAQWRRISQEEHLVARAADVGDEIGSRIIAARLVRDLMRLGFLQERTYAPYPKWFGTAFRELSIAPVLGPPLERVLDAGDWPARESALVVAYEIAARRQNELGIGEPGPERASPFFDRPFRVIWGDTFSDSIYATIGDPEVRALPRHLGAIDQVSDSTDLLSYTALRARLRPLYESR